MPQILLKQQLITYELRRSRRARRMRLAVRPDASVSLTLPWRADLKQAEKFIQSKAAWVLKHVRYYQQRAVLPSLKITAADYAANKAAALKLAQSKVEYFNKFYNFKYHQVTVKNQKTRWGSCSRRGNLNFNFKLMFLPAVTADYIIVHELCHLREMNHSPRFWALVAKTFPNYKLIRQDLKRAGLGLM